MVNIVISDSIEALYIVGKNRLFIAKMKDFIGSFLFCFMLVCWTKLLDFMLLFDNLNDC